MYNGIYFIVTGGGGAPLYDQSRASPYSQMFIKTYHFCQLSVADNQLTLDVWDPIPQRIDQVRILSKR